MTSETALLCRHLLAITAKWRETADIWADDKFPRGPKGDEMTKPVELVCPVCGRVVPHGACACVGDGLSAHGATIPRPRQ